jgi:hypothetical protein
VYGRTLTGRSLTNLVCVPIAPPNAGRSEWPIEKYQAGFGERQESLGKLL